MNGEFEPHGKGVFKWNWPAAAAPAEGEDKGAAEKKSAAAAAAAAAAPAGGDAGEGKAASSGPQPDDPRTWKEFSGEFASGHHTKGKMVYVNDSTFEGTFDAQGTKQGAGKLVHKGLVNAFKFEGEFLDGRRTKGKLSTASDVYEGGFDGNEQRSGQGELRFLTDKRVFSGNFLNGAPVSGTLTYHGSGGGHGEVEYKGDVDETLQRHGKGSLMRVR